MGQRLAEDGLTLAPVPPSIWRLPTVDEAVHSVARHGRNSGGVWDEETAQASYETTPDKESPLWGHCKISGILGVKENSNRFFSCNLVVQVINLIFKKDSEMRFSRRQKRWMVIVLVIGVFILIRAMQPKQPQVLLEMTYVEGKLVYEGYGIYIDAAGRVVYFEQNSPLASWSFLQKPDDELLPPIVLNLFRIQGPFISGRRLYRRYGDNQQIVGRIPPDQMKQLAESLSALQSLMPVLSQGLVSAGSQSAYTAYLYDARVDQYRPIPLLEFGEARQKECVDPRCRDVLAHFISTLEALPPDAHIDEVVLHDREAMSIRDALTRPRP